ncbi:PhzF family phenazine biosynthesis protein [Uliginosibacterium sp. 31-16]|uniref:PhzF family phenazine biosynthesis protein n=1 Tax=Uliginosibacterium sp. 31-16 TaxID=3068315 RepID=UPI00273EBFD7|nr:PhzF family phenazine biosynthesis protein [Uliginosibacterium sp. 31-16]MDP5239175.1 PhzF family phenazine biosynthesis protein [Uliginosibacterium sp. 31-16]
MKNGIQQFVVDAFASRPFSGNPAAVCPLAHWPEDALLQAIAAENNLSETAFFVAEEEGFRLRWFTPRAEVDLCGHATLASAHVLFSQLGYTGQQIAFFTRSGTLTVRRDGEMLVMDFPAREALACAPSAALSTALGAAPVELLAADVYLAVFADEDAIRALQPDIGLIAALDKRAVIVTAPGREVDFVSRYFAPKMGVPEDPVTGSAHCLLTPFWAKRLGRTTLQAHQLSARGGVLHCSLQGARVLLAGRALSFSQATLFIEY